MIMETIMISGYLSIYFNKITKMLAICVKLANERWKVSA